MSTDLYCNFCGAAIGGEYVEYDNGLQLCAACFQGAARCVWCDLPLAPGTRGPLCPACRREADVCSSCGTPLVDRFWTHPSAEGSLLCDDCFQAGHFCDLCGGGLTQPIWELSDGRRCCTACHATALYDPVEGRRILQEVRDFAARELGLYNSAELAFDFVSAAQMREMCEEMDVSPPFEMERSLGMFLSVDGFSTVVVEYGLPEVVARQIIAHEYAHSWQSEHCRPGQTFALYEGFAEWVAQQYLCACGHARFAAQLARRQDPYGQALQGLLALEQRLGRRALLNYVRMQTDLEGPGEPSCP
jgi:hypothetical protein